MGKAKQITSHNISIQTDTEDKIESVNVMKPVKPQRKAKVMPPIKPSKLIIKMEKRAVERKEKREMLMELKKQKEQKYKDEIARQKQIELDKIKENKRLEKEKKIKILQQQQRIKEIEHNKLILSQMHYKRALLLYCGWIPW